MCLFNIKKNLVDEKYFIIQKKFERKILLRNYKKIKKYLIIS
jgi:hypothetical protein